MALSHSKWGTETLCETGNAQGRPRASSTPPATHRLNCAPVSSALTGTGRASSRWYRDGLAWNTMRSSPTSSVDVAVDFCAPREGSEDRPAPRSPRSKTPSDWPLHRHEPASAAQSPPQETPGDPLAAPAGRADGDIHRVTEVKAAPARDRAPCPWRTCISLYAGGTPRSSSPAVSVSITRGLRAKAWPMRQKSAHGRGLTGGGTPATTHFLLISLTRVLTRHSCGCSAPMTLRRFKIL